MQMRLFFFFSLSPSNAQQDTLSADIKQPGLWVFFGFFSRARGVCSSVNSQGEVVLEVLTSDPRRGGNKVGRGNNN